MKLLKQTKSKNYFEKQFHNETVQFKQQFTAQRTLKQNLEQNNVDISTWTSRKIIVAAPKNKSSQPIGAKHKQLSILHPLLAYYKQGDKLVHQSYVFVSDEPSHDAIFVFVLITKPVPTLLELSTC